MYLSNKLIYSFISCSISIIFLINNTSYGDPGGGGGDSQDPDSFLSPQERQDKNDAVRYWHIKDNLEPEEYSDRDWKLIEQNLGKEIKNKMHIKVEKLKNPSYQKWALNNFSTDVELKAISADLVENISCRESPLRVIVRIHHYTYESQFGNGKQSSSAIAACKKHVQVLKENIKGASFLNIYPGKKGFIWIESADASKAAEILTNTNNAPQKDIGLQINNNARNSDNKLNQTEAISIKSNSGKEK